MTPRVAALFVNYNSGEYLFRATSSLYAQRIDGRPAEVEVVIVDNASPERARDMKWLARLRDEHGATLVLNDRNDGYAGGMNLALSHSRAPVVAALNPDLLLGAGALETLLGALLSDESVGVVGPRGYLDEDRVLMLPINQLPTLDDEMGRFRGRFSPRASLAHSIPLARESYALHRATEPREIGMLSGACLLLRRSTIDRLGFFDARFPLFYEDSDLCRRVSNAGLRVLYVPAASIVHFVSRSVATAPKSDDPKKRWEVARRRYYRKWYGPLGLALVERIDAEAPRFWRRSGPPATPCVDLGELDAAPTLRFSRPVPEALVEVGLDSGFYLTASTIATGDPTADSWTFPPMAWSIFFTGVPVFVRAIDPRDFSVIGTWAFTTKRP